MIDAWKVLMDLGLPDGAARPAPRVPFDPQRVRAAVDEVVPALERARVAPLAAWLGALRRHWGTRFHETFGSEGEVLIRMLVARVDDPNRYLKLRRISIANLARIL